jgi:hypothetical protein
MVGEYLWDLKAVFVIMDLKREDLKDFFYSGADPSANSGEVRTSLCDLQDR